jgi:hypothetical protein
VDDTWIVVVGVRPPLSLMHQSQFHFVECRTQSGKQTAECFLLPWQQSNTPVATETIANLLPVTRNAVLVVSFVHLLATFNDRLNNCHEQKKLLCRRELSFVS